MEKAWEIDVMHKGVMRMEMKGFFSYIELDTFISKLLVIEKFTEQLLDGK